MCACVCVLWGVLCECGRVLCECVCVVVGVYFHDLLGGCVCASGLWVYVGIVVCMGDYGCRGRINVCVWWVVCV